MGERTSAEAEGRCELAWAAGFFDGEGWAGTQQGRDRRTAQPMAMINQAGDDGVPEVLTRFRDAVGVGTLYGPTRQPGRRDLYRWSVSSRANVAHAHDVLTGFLGEVKEREFRAALGLSEAPETRRATTSEVELAWAAGLYDGEGWTGLTRHRSHEGYFALEAAVTQASPAGVPEVLERFFRAVAAGRIGGPIHQKQARTPVYRWKAYGLGQIGTMFAALLPCLSAPKRLQALTAIEVIRAQPPLPRGNLAWGAYKTHCVHGHEYATARVRPYASRGVGKPRRANKHCLVCVREAAAKKRAARQAALY